MTMPSAVSKAMNPARVSPNGGAGRADPTNATAQASTRMSAARTAASTADACRGPQASLVPPRPTVGDLPAPPARRGGDTCRDRLEQAVRGGGRTLADEPARDLPVDVEPRAHAIRSPSMLTTRASASSAARIVWMPRWSRDFTVPIGRPRMSAIWFSGKALDVVEHDDRSFLDAEPAERTFELVSIEQVRAARPTRHARRAVAREPRRSAAAGRDVPLDGTSGRGSGAARPRTDRDRGAPRGHARRRRAPPGSRPTPGPDRGGSAGRCRRAGRSTGARAR